MRAAPVPLNDLSRSVYEVLCDLTAFPWPILSTQCRRHAADPANLGVAELRTILDDLVAGVAAYTSPGKGNLVRERLAPMLHKGLG